MIDLARCRQLKENFDLYYQERLKADIDSARDRVRMIMDDAAEREERGLSALPSTKSMSIVDGYVENALLAYTQDPDSISFTPRNLTDAKAEQACRLLTQNFIYRSDATADFLVWHEASLRAGATDGIECAMVSWVRDSYTEDVPAFYALNTDGSTTEIDEQTYIQNAPLLPGAFTIGTKQTETVTRDTWVIDQLMLGRDFFYDPSIRLLNANRGQFAGVILRKTVDDIVQYQKIGLFDPSITRDEIEKYQKTGDTLTTVANLVTFQDDRDNIDLNELNLVPLCVFFHKDAGCWKVQFSLDWRQEMTDWLKVNDVFFAGRPVNLLPVVVGYGQSALWEAVGMSMPVKIAPIEDELSNHRNNANDIAKAIAQGGRIRISPDADIDIDQVLNARAYIANQGDVEFVQYNPGMMEALRMDDARNQDIAALVPVSSTDRARQLAGKGTTRTLGMSQMLEQDSQAKLGVQLVLRNATFMKPLLYLIAQLTIAFETDPQVMAIAAQKAGVKLPVKLDMQGNQLIDWKFLDIPFDVQINAGLGSVPRYKKAGALGQIAEFRRAYNVPTDFAEIAAQMSVLGGFTPESFFPKDQPPPPPPPVEYKATIAIDLAQIPLEAQQKMLDMMMNGQMSVTAKIDGDNPAMKEAMQNGGGMMSPDRTGEMVDSTGEEGLMMSQGGQNG